MDNLRMRSILIALEFDGPSVAMLPDSKLLCGVRAANEALQSRIGTDELLSDGAGLFMVHSHEQGKDSVALHARMLLKRPARTTCCDMRRSFGQQQCRDIMRKGKSFSRGHGCTRTHGWAQVRMLIMTKVNLAIVAGVRAIASAVKILRLFRGCYTHLDPTHFQRRMVWRCWARSLFGTLLLVPGSSSRPESSASSFLPSRDCCASEWIIFCSIPIEASPYGRLRQHDCFRSGAANPEPVACVPFPRSECLDAFLGLEPYTSSENGATASRLRIHVVKAALNPTTVGWYNTHNTLALSSSGSLPSSPKRVSS